MSKRKIFNDPIYGLLYFPFDIIYELIDHPYFQRLRRISQMGLCHYIYPGALHTRFHHALGAVHLMGKALDTLKSKGIEITNKEYEGACIAILLHDIGHGPYSHALEHKIVSSHHENISILFMEALNLELDGRLDLAISIFKGEYFKHFLHQLVSSQLDVDRLDYLTRDSFYSGVAEGVIGYDRIIKMLNVVDNRIVVEEKGIHSIEKFLHSRRIMYWQVYLHKTVVSVEQMLVKFLELIKEHREEPEVKAIIPNSLAYFIYRTESFGIEDLSYFARIDDVDVLQLVKKAMYINNFNLNYVAKCLINRRLFKSEVSKSPFECDLIDQKRHIVGTLLNVSSSDARKLIFQRKEEIDVYKSGEDAINLLLKSGNLIDFRDHSDFIGNYGINNKYFLCYPRYKC